MCTEDERLGEQSLFILPMEINIPVAHHKVMDAILPFEEADKALKSFKKLMDISNVTSSFSEFALEQLLSKNLVTVKAEYKLSMRKLQSAVVTAPEKYAAFKNHNQELLKKFPVIEDNLVVYRKRTIEQLQASYLSTVEKSTIEVRGRRYQLVVIGDHSGNKEKLETIEKFRVSINVRSAFGGDTRKLINKASKVMRALAKVTTVAGLVLEVIDTSVLSYRLLTAKDEKSRKNIEDALFLKGGAKLIEGAILLSGIALIIGFTTISSAAAVAGTSLVVGVGFFIFGDNVDDSLKVIIQDLRKPKKMLKKGDVRRVLIRGLPKDEETQKILREKLDTSALEKLVESFPVYANPKLPPIR